MKKSVSYFNILNRQQVESLTSLFSFYGIVKDYSLYKIYSNNYIFLYHANEFVIELEDIMDVQGIVLPKCFSLDEGDRITFEIIEVYPGMRLRDTAISEISFLYNI